MGGRGSASGAGGGAAVASKNKPNQKQLNNNRDKIDTVEKKKMIETHSWTTKGGADIEIEIERINEPVYIKDDWGGEHHVGDEERLQAKSVVVNGKKLTDPSVGYNHRFEANVVEGKLDGRPVAVILSDKADESLYGEQKRQTERNIARMEAEGEARRKQAAWERRNDAGEGNY